MTNPYPRRGSMTALSGLFSAGCMIFGFPCLSPLMTNPVPKETQAILVLGGDPNRERFAAQFALKHPQLPIYVSSGSPKEYSEYVFDRAGINRDRVHLDYRAVDTVTNFTTMVTDFQKQRISDIYVITSDFHMPRALVIGKVVLGSRGIQMHPVPVPTNVNAEDSAKSLRDGLRSVFWLVSGF